MFPFKELLHSIQNPDKAAELSAEKKIDNTVRAHTRRQITFFRQSFIRPFVRLSARSPGPFVLPLGCWACAPHDN